MPFVNGSSDQLQTQSQDSQYHSATLLFRQDLSICLSLTGGFWQASANLYSEEKLQKGARAGPQSTTLRFTVNTQHLCEGRKSATATHVEQ